MVSKRPLSPNFFSLSKDASYYDNIKLKDLKFEFSETTPEKILNDLKGLNQIKAADFNNLSGKFLKDGAYILATQISELLNLSVNLNSSPRSCKNAKVKAQSLKTDPRNYRPISLLPLFSKNMERFVHEQIQEILSKNKILYRF